MMKKRFVAYTIILILGLGLFLNYQYPQPVRNLKKNIYLSSLNLLKGISPDAYCNVFSGTASLAWGFDPSYKSDCITNGCAVIDKTTTQRTDCFDCDVVKFKCVAK